MKKLLLFFLPIVLVSCSDGYPKQSCFTIKTIQSISHEHITSDSALKIYNSFCHYQIEGAGYQITITDSTGKYQIGDTVVFGKRIINVIDTTNTN